MVPGGAIGIRGFVILDDMDNQTNNVNAFDEAAASWDSAAYRVERARLVAERIIGIAGSCACGRVLDFGCGTGLLGFHFANSAESMVFADTSVGMLEQVSQKAREQNLAKVSTLLLEDNGLEGEYDLIVSLMALHHIPDHEGAIRDLAGHLSPGGILFLCDLESEDGSFHGESVVPHNGFNPCDIVKSLSGCGLQDASSSTAHVDRKLIEGVIHEYPLFLAHARKA